MPDLLRDNPLSNDRVAFLHGLRGIAVLFVLVSHYGWAKVPLIPFVDNRGVGKAGVWLFFILSAYLLTLRLTDSLKRNPDSKVRAVGAYFIRRVFRIFPLYTSVLIGLLLLNLMTFSDVISHLLLQKGKFVLWAIPVEFKYYLVIPIICLLIVNLGTKSARVILAIGAVCGLAYSIPLQARVFSNSIDLLTYIPIFLIGSLCALSFRQLISPKIRVVLLVISLCGVYVATLGHQAWILHQVKNALAPWISLLMGVSWAGVILFGSSVALFHRVCSGRVAVFFGEISFSLYLLHAIILGYFRGVHFLPEYMMGPAILLLTVGVSVVTHYLVEKPGMRLGKTLSGRVRQWRVYS